MQPGNLFNTISETAGTSLTGHAGSASTKENGPSKTFSSVDMWNIHRQKKTLVIR